MNKIVEFFSGLIMGLLVTMLVLSILSYHFGYSKNISAEVSSYSTPYNGNYSSGSLSAVEGKEILGMILAALDGKYYITVDGVRIDSSTNMETVNVAGVLSKSYSLSVIRSSDGNVQGVIAN